MKPRHGMTLLEVLVCLALIAVLLSLLAPSLANVRRSAHDVRIASDLRSHAQVFASYAIDSADAFPFFVDPQATVTVLRLSSGRVIELRQPFSSAYYWNYALADAYYGGAMHHDSFYPPGYPRRLTGSSVRAGPTPYQYACTFIAHPNYWMPERRLRGRSQLQRTLQADVLFPSRKALLSPWYPLTVELPDGVGRTSYTFQSIATVDGAVRHVATNQIVPGYFSGDGDPDLGVHLHDVPPWGMHTIGGVRGFDLP